MKIESKIENDISIEIEKLAGRQKPTVSEVIPKLARIGLESVLNPLTQNCGREPKAFYGFIPISGGVPVTNEHVNHLRDLLGV
jgi:hypothetical protein